MQMRMNCEAACGHSRPLQQRRCLTMCMRPACPCPPHSPCMQLRAASGTRQCTGARRAAFHYDAAKRRRSASPTLHVCAARRSSVRSCTCTCHEGAPAARWRRVARTCFMAALGSNCWGPAGAMPICICCSFSSSVSGAIAQSHCDVRTPRRCERCIVRASRAYHARPPAATQTGRASQTSPRCTTTASSRMTHPEYCARASG